MADNAEPGDGPVQPPIVAGMEDWQHWAGVVARAQQMMLDHVARQAAAPEPMAEVARALAGWGIPFADPARLMQAQADFWKDGMALWQRMLAPAPGAAPAASADKRFADPAWQEHPLFGLIRQAYELGSTHMLRSLDTIENLDPKQREQLRFATRGFLDAIAPTNFAATNPKAWERMIETRGESLLKGLRHLLDDLARGQLTHTDPAAFELGRNIATTPGKVIHETPLYQLIHYAPVTETVQATPLIIFPPWINRFYILDLNPKKSFVRWALANGLSVFMVSWRSADESLAHVRLDDYVAAQLDAIEVVRDLLAVEQVHAIGYCVAGTTLAATLALLAARQEQDKVASATFFTAQVDFAKAGDLRLFVDDAQLQMLEALAGERGYVDGRYLAATFNLLRSRDLIWNYVVNNYLMGEDYPAFDLLHWNGDTTNLPAGWHQDYLRDFYRDNRLVQPGAISVQGVPIDLGRVTTPTYVQAGREDHIAPAESVWEVTRHFRGPLRFVLAGSGHIAGVVNPPEAAKYQYWTADDPGDSFADFLAKARETKGSWWPDWLAWLSERSGGDVPAIGARVPGGGKRKAIEDAPGRYVKLR